MQDVMELRVCWVWRQGLDSRMGGGWASILTATEMKLKKFIWEASLLPKW